MQGCLCQLKGSLLVLSAPVQHNIHRCARLNAILQIEWSGKCAGMNADVVSKLTHCDSNCTQFT
jgi:hypothetical protein